MTYRDLRDFLQALEKEGEINKIQAELSPRFEVSAAMKIINDSRVVQFENITGYPGKKVVGKSLEVAIALGVDPATQIAATVKATAEGPDKLAVAGGLNGAAVELTKAESVDLLVPARAGIIMEGRIIPGLREHEGPFGEATGHYFEDESQVIEIHTVTHRKEFILSVIQVWGSETDVLITLGGSPDHKSFVHPSRGTGYQYTYQCYSGS